MFFGFSTINETQHYYYTLLNHLHDLTTWFFDYFLNTINTYEGMNYIRGQRSAFS